MAETIIFYIMAILTIGAAAVTVVSKNIIRSAFALLGTLVGVATIFGMMGAEFLAVIQVMIYVGGVMVLILFAVMLTNRIKDVKVSNTSLPILPGAMVSCLIFAILVFGIRTGIPNDVQRVEKGMVTSIGQSLLSGYSLLFAVSIVLLIASMICAIVIARKKDAPVCPAVCDPGKKGGEA